MCVGDTGANIVQVSPRSINLLSKVKRYDFMDRGVAYTLSYVSDTEYLGQCISDVEYRVSTDVMHAASLIFRTVISIHLLLTYLQM